MFMLILFGGIFLVAIVLMIGLGNNAELEATENERIIKAGYVPDLFIDSGKYISGHPSINEPILKSYLYIKENELEIFKYDELTFSKINVAKIPIDDIDNITMEDETSIKSRVGLKRMLALGLFAFAVKKKVKNELGYVVIEWKSGRFTNETVFELEGNNAITRTNKFRNTLINRISEAEQKSE